MPVTKIQPEEIEMIARELSSRPTVREAAGSGKKSNGLHLISLLTNG